MAPFWPNVLRSVGDDCFQTPTEVALHCSGIDSGHDCSLTEIPTGTAYSVWVGIGAALTLGYSMAVGQEPATISRGLLILTLVRCIVGLKTVS